MTYTLHQGTKHVDKTTLDAYFNSHTDDEIKTAARNGFLTIPDRRNPTDKIMLYVKGINGTQIKLKYYTTI